MEKKKPHAKKIASTTVKITDAPKVNRFKTIIKLHKLTILSLIAALSVLYITSGVFGESKVSSSYKLINTVLLYLSIFSIGCVFISLFNNFWRKVIIVNWTIIFIIIGAFEYYMKTTNYDNILNYSEVNGYGFSTDYINYKKALEKRESGILLYQHPDPNSQYSDNKPEFNFTYQLDKLGNNNNISCGRPDAKVKIITIGDSYTFGIGASAKRSWPNQLDSILALNNISSSICNVATSGSDPVYMFNVYREYYVKSLPGEIILVNINSSDAKDIAVRGGSDRYNKPYIKGEEKWLPYYASSLIYRMYMQKVKNIEPYLLVERQKVDSLYLDAFDHIFNTIIQFDQFAKTHNKQVVFVFNPGYHEVLSNQLLFGPIVDEARNFNFNVIDLLPAFQNAYRQTGNVFDFFWEKDFHNNELGYKIWAEEVYKYLYDKQLLNTN